MCVEKILNVKNLGVKMSSFVRFFTKRKSHKEKDGEKEENNQVRKLFFNCEI